MAGRPFSKVDASPTGFQRSFKKLSPEIKELVYTAIKELYGDPIPRRLDFKKLKTHRNPSVWTVTISGNHAYKMSMEIRDGVAILRRVGTHKQIDDNP